MSYEQKSCDSFRLYDFYVPFYQMKNQYVFFRVIHIQCAVKPLPLMGGGGGGVSARLSQLYHHIFRATGEYIRLDAVALLDFYFLSPLRSFSSCLKITESSVV